MDIQFTLTDGLNRDISKDKFPTTAYYYLLNGRITSTRNASLSDITNVLGNTNALINNGSLDRDPITFKYSIIGYSVIRNDIVLFYANDNSKDSDNFTSTSIIDLLKYKSNDNYDRIQLWSGIGLNFRIDKPIKAIGRYETPLVQKIYWCDNNNTLKFANIAPDTEEFPSIYSKINNYSINDFETIKDIKLGGYKPSFYSYSDGQLFGGIIQYAYRLCDKYGTYTLFSDTSEPIILTKGSINSDILSLQGMETAGQTAEFNTGKGVTIKLDLSHIDNRQYSTIEIVSLYSASYYDTPTVSIIGRRDIQNTILFTDRGGVADYGTITYVDFLLQNSNFSAKTLEVKDDILFAGNLKEEYFNLDEELGYYWDARAYRYKANHTNTCLIHNGIRYEYSQSTLERVFNNDPNPFNPTHDCINPYNLEWDINNLSGYGNMGGYGNEDFAFRPGGTILGGRGTNVRYNFLQTTMALDNLDNDRTYNKIGITDFDLGRQTSWRRGEVYRFGITFFDKKGRQSFVKWIGDIKIPDNIIKGKIYRGGGGFAYPISQTFTTGNANILQPNFTIYNVPDINGEILDYRIVYVKREQFDKTILTHGLLFDMFAAELGTTKSIPIHSGGNNNSSQLALVSPEITINTNFLNNFDNTNIKVYGPVAFPSSLKTGILEDNKLKYIIEKVTAINKSIDNTTFLCEDTRLVLPTEQWSIKANYSYDLNTGPDYKINGIGGRKLIFTTSGLVENLQDNYLNQYSIIEIRSNTIGYGGYAYVDRFFNTYIPASDIQQIINFVSIDFPAKYGDTYLCMMEYQNILYNVNSEITTGDKRFLTHTVYFPCESDYNLRLRYDDTFGRNSSNFFSYFIQETGNELLSYKSLDKTGVFNSFETITATTKWKDLYSYDTVFNKRNEVYKYFPKPQDYTPVTKTDTLIRYSDKKLNGEEIDSWVTFRPNNYNSVNSNYGELNRLIQFTDYLFFFQDSAVGIATVNPLVTTVSTQGTETILGVGGVLETFTYLSTNVGCQDNSDIIKSFSSLYWLDKNNKKLYTYVSGDSGGIGSISDLKNIHSYLRNTIYEDSYFRGCYDVKNSQILMTVLNNADNTLFVANDLGNNIWTFSGNNLITDVTEITKFVEGSVYKIGSGFFRFNYASTMLYCFTYLYGTKPIDGNLINLSDYIFERTNFTLGYNEITSFFESFYSFLPTLYVQHTKGFFSTRDNKELYQHDKGDFYNYFYGEYFPTTIKIIIAGASSTQLECTNVKFFGEMRDFKGNYLRNEIITNVSAKNNYQQSEDIILYPFDLNDDYRGIRTILETSGERIGIDWYPGLLTPNEGIVLYDNKRYRNISGTILNTLPTPGLDWKLCELANIRKTIEHWMLQFPRYKSFIVNPNTLANINIGEYQTVDRFRGSWIELTLELKDVSPMQDIKTKNLLLSDIRVSVNPTIY